MVEPALRHERNPYMVAHVMNRFAVLALPVMPESAQAIVRRYRGRDGKSQNNAQLVEFLAAARLAASSPTLHAMKLMLDSHGTIDGHPFSAPVEAQAELGEWLARTETADVIPLLLDATDTDSTVAQSIASLALAQILRVGSHIESDTIDRVLRGVAADTTREPYIRRSALNGIVELHRHRHSADEAGELLTTLCSDLDEQFRVEVFSAVVALGLLESHRDVVEAAAGLDTESAAYLAGQLAVVEPHRYAERAAQVLRIGNDDSAHAVLSGYSRNSERRLPDPMAEALVARIRRGERRASANPPLLTDLATLAPDRLIDEDWGLIWSQWMPESRAALAAALPQAITHVAERRPRASDLLLALVTDGVYAVRRVASRSLAIIDVERLNRWCAEALGASPIKLRMMGAEAACWLPIDDERTLDNESVRRASGDLERVVREAAQQSRQDMRKRRWCRELLQQISQPRADPNDWVLESYTLGRALASIGDDENLAQLESMSRDPALPPNVRYWLRLVAGDLEKQWRKTTQTWPQSSYPWSGAREQLTGGITVDGAQHRASVALWRRRRSTPGRPESWGGAATFSSESPMVFKALDAESVILDLPGRPPASIAVVESSDRRIIFLGNDLYPDERSA